MPKQKSAYPECRHILTTGRKCKGPALKGRPFCHHHARQRNYSGRNQRSINSVELPPLEDHSSVVLAIDQIIFALTHRRITDELAARLLYAIQLAQNSLNRIKEVAPEEMVTDYVNGRFGDIAAPAEPGNESWSEPNADPADHDDFPLLSEHSDTPADLDEYVLLRECRGLPLIRPWSCAARRSACLACCATGGAASGPRQRRPFTNGVTNFTACAWGIPRSLQRGRELLHRARSGVLLPADRRSGSGAATGSAGLENMRQQQASSLAYLDCFWMFAVLTFALVFVALFMKRSVAEKGAHHVVE